MNSLEKTEDKVNFIVKMFKHYQVNLTIPEQIGLLTVWEESCVLNEEYEIPVHVTSLVEGGKITVQGEFFNGAEVALDMMALQMEAGEGEDEDDGDR